MFARNNNNICIYKFIILIFIFFVQVANTFQAVLVTDAVHSFLILNYRDFNWIHDFLYNQHVIQGFTCGQLGKSYYVPIPNDYRDRPNNVIGNFGKKGRWIYQVDSLPDDFVNPYQYCRNWNRRQRFDRSFSYFHDLYADTCPCSLIMAWLDRRYVPVTHSYVLPTQGGPGIRKEPCTLLLFVYFMSKISLLLNYSL